MFLLNSNNVKALRKVILLSKMVACMWYMQVTILFNLNVSICLSLTTVMIVRSYFKFSLSPCGH